MKNHLQKLSTSVCAIAIASLAACASPEPQVQTVQKADILSGICTTSNDELKTHGAQALLGTGYEALMAGNLSCASRLLGLSHQLDSANPWTLLNMGVVHAKQGQFDNARLAYQMAGAMDVDRQQKKTYGLTSQSTQSSTRYEGAAASATQDAAGKSLYDIALKNLNQLP
jgi:Tfp pilus assembly protein PilF